MTIDELKDIFDILLKTGGHKSLELAVIREASIDIKRLTEATEALSASFEAFVAERRESSHYPTNVRIVK